MRRTLVIFFSFITISAGAQTADWWASNVNWDGVTHWTRYLIYSPGYFGPNALPVPEIGNGSIDSVSTIGVTGNFHFSKGDNTQNIKLTGNFLVAKNKVSIDLAYIPVEWFQVDHATKTMRRVYYKNYYDKKTDVDFYVNIVIQLLNKWRKHIHLAGRIGLRIPASSAYGAARYTDAPAYYFDLSAGKPLSPSSPFKIVAMAGFYAWQTNDDDLFQDDALLLGAGLEYNRNQWRVQLNNCAYYGYRDNRDDPMVLRAAVEKRIRRFTALVKFQQGLQDFDYSTVEAGLKVNL